MDCSHLVAQCTEIITLIDSRCVPSPWLLSMREWKRLRDVFTPPQIEGNWRMNKSPFIAVVMKLDSMQSSPNIACAVIKMQGLESWLVFTDT
jgi:hypothetical protein